MLGSSQDAEIGGYRAHPSAAAHYGGQYSSVYGSAALSSGQQVSGYFISAEECPITTTLPLVNLVNLTVSLFLFGVPQNLHLSLSSNIQNS